MLGAGFAGLQTAFWLAESGVPVTVLERAERAGGLLDTVETEAGFAERAANGFLWCDEMQFVADRIGLAIQSPGPAARSRYLVRGGRLRKMPLGPLELLGLLGRLLRPGGRRVSTVEEFGLRCLGPAATNHLVAPALAGIYGAQPAELGLASILPGLAAQLERAPFPLAALLRFARSRRAARGGGQTPSGTHGFAGGMGGVRPAHGRASPGKDPVRG